MQKMPPFIHQIRHLWQHITPRRRVQFGLVLILMLIASCAEVLSIGAVLPFIAALAEPQRIYRNAYVQPVIHALGVTSADQLLLPLTMAFIAAAIFAGAMRLTLLRVSLRLSFAAGTDLSLKIYRRTLYQPYAVHISRNSSEIINGITIKNSEVIFYIISPALTLVSSIIVLIAIIATLLSVVPMVAFVAFGIFAAIYGLIIRLTRNRLKADSENIARESTNVIKILQEGLGGIRDVLLDGTQETFCAIYSNADQILRRAQSNNLFISQSPRFGMEAMAILLISLLAYILTRQSANVAGSFPVLAALALGMQRLLPYSQQAYGSWTTIRGAEASLRDVLLLLDQPLPEYADQAAPLDPMPFSREIVLKQLSFRYGPQSSWVLQDIHLAIPRGSRVGFIGATGCGKSTLLDLIMGLLQPTAGTIEIDGTVITPDNLRMWQSHIAHVPQAIFLTDSSIEENIAFGVPWHLIDHDRVRNAAAQAQIADIIESWPNQYQTVVGERGVQISGGQRQRIGIARALYKNADVIIFDESTSALDSETEQAVMRAIDSLSDELTVLIIAHRLSTLKNCSHIVELAHGSIVLREN